MSEHNEQDAVSAAESWLAMIDVTDTHGSWENAASLFKSAVDKESWTESLKGAQGPLGKPVGRKLKSTKLVSELPGAPDGEYCVIEYDTEFEHKKNGMETVVPMKDSDGEWRVSGYFVK